MDVPTRFFPVDFLIYLGRRARDFPGALANHFGCTGAWLGGGAIGKVGRRIIAASIPSPIRLNTTPKIPRIPGINHFSKKESMCPAPGRSGRYITITLSPTA